MIINNASFICPCGSRQSYTQCCARWHTTEQYLQAPNAQVLMRSRYSAYVLDLRAYLLQTWHPATRPTSIEPPQAGLEWRGLKIKKFTIQDATHATVAFVARYQLHGKNHRLQELSYFEHINQCWYYVNGITMR